VHYGAVAQSLVLLTLANGSPVIAKRIFGDHFSSPIDGGTKYMDGRAVFGSSKTTRGVLVSILVTTAGSPLLGLELKVGFLAGITAVLVNPQAVGQQASIRFQNRYCRCFLAVRHFC
jgi:hypothetical protein